jgi:hypothetical protein
VKGTWQTTGGGGGWALPVAVIGGLLVMAPVLTALAHLAQALALLVFSLVALGVSALVAVLVLQNRRRSVPRVVPGVPWARGYVPAAERAAAPVTAGTGRVAIGQPGPAPVHTHIHVHLAGQDPEADAAAVRALTERSG